MHRSTPGPSRWCALLLASATACGGGSGGPDSESAGTGSAGGTDATSGPTSAPTTRGSTEATTSAEAPVLASFAAAPASVPPGMPTQVTWTWTYANQPDPAPSCSIDHGVGALQSGTAASVTLAADTAFTLTCTNAAGADTAQTSVTVGTAAIIPAERLPPPGTWESAGVEGGIPERDTICADVTQAPYNADATGNASASAAIQAAIDACPDEQVVFIPAGIYRIDATLRLSRPITLRGAGSGTVLRAETGDARTLAIGGLGPWPPPKANPAYHTPITGGAARASTSVSVADTTPIEVGKMIMVDEEDDPELVWTKADVPGRYRASMHMVESKTATSVTFRPPLPIDFTRNPQLSWFPDLAHDVGVEHVHFLGTGAGPGLFVEIFGAWNAWVLGCEFSAMPKKTVMVAWSGHVELRRIYMHDQANGGPDSEGLDLLADVNWSLVVDNICVAAGFPQINIGDGGANPNYSGGFGNVVAYNYCVDAFYTDPPDAPDAGKMPSDISTNHSPHTQYNLIEGNVAGKFGSDAYHGSGSHTVMLRNRVTGASGWPGVSNHTAVQIDRRNLYYALVGNVLGRAGSPATFAYATESGWSGSAIYRLGFPDIGNDGYSGTFPPTDLLHGDGGPRDLYVDRDDTSVGTTLIEGNWDATLGAQDWTIEPQPIPDSYFLAGKPSWFGSLAWPPVDPAAPVSDDPTIIPAGYRYVHGSDPPP